MHGKEGLKRVKAADEDEAADAGKIVDVDDEATG